MNIRALQFLVFSLLFTLSCGHSKAVEPREAPASGPNIVRNGGFEDGLSPWSELPGMTALAAAARSGGRGLRYENTDPGSYRLVAQEISAHAGEFVAASAWVKGQEVVSPSADKGAGLYLESYGRDGQWVGGAYPTCMAGTFDWTRIETTYYVPENAVKTIIGLYFRRATVGTASFDDVEVRAQSNPSASILFDYPNYRGLIIENAANGRRPWRATLRLRGFVEPENKKDRVPNVLVASSVLDVEGKVLHQRRQQFPTKNLEHRLALQVPKLPPGQYIWKLKISGQNIKEQIFDMPVQVSRQAPAVYIDEAGYTVVDGKRFFPLGLYLWPAGEDEMQRIAASKFNTVLSYNYGFATDSSEYLDRAQKHGLKVVYSLKDMYGEGLPWQLVNGHISEMAPPAGTPRKAMLAIAAEHLEALRNKPALLAWYINDELGPDTIPQLQKMYDQVRTLDPQHPAYQVLFQVGIMNQYLNTLDVLGADPYPVGGPDLQITTDHARQTMEAAHGAKGVWPVIQAHDWAVYKGASHPPSREEMRNQAYQAIIAGAKGLFFYSYFDLWLTDQGRDPKQANFDKRWPDVAAAAADVNEIVPALLQGEDVSLNIQGKSRVVVRGIRHDNQLLLLFANPYYSEEKLTLEMPAGWKLPSSQPGKVQVVVDGGNIQFIFSSLASGVVRLVRK